MSKTNSERPKAIYGVRDTPREDPAATSRLVVAQGAAPAGQVKPLAPFTYRAFPSLLSEQETATKPEPKKILPGETEKRAVWIVHGMGQQIPFETLDSLTEGILRVAGLPAGAVAFTPTACSIRVGDEVLQRVELKVRSHDNQKDIELHLYEAYWAPLTEGVANLRDVVGFLVNGALRGFLNSLKTFKRAMFGEICDFKIQMRVPLYILAVLALLGSLAIINAVILAATANQLEVFGIKINVLTDSWTMLTAVASAMSALAITLGAILFLAETCKSTFASGFQRNILSWISWLGTGIASAGMIVTALLFLLAVWPNHAPAALMQMPAKQLQFFSTTTILAALLLIGLALTTRATKRSEAAETQENGFLLFLLALALLLHIAAIAGLALSCFGVRCAWPQSLAWAAGAREFLSSPWWIWPFLIFLSAKVRTLMIEYVGDVVIYVTSNKIDRFSQVRSKIKDTAYKSASAVFHAMAETGNHFEYEKIAVVGHSLGSVIAYDTLNRLINEDRMTEGKLRAAGRTCVFETFGSPLNKIAFFFTILGSDSFQIREQLAESVQPLIMNYRYRPFRWINVRSRNDIISGAVYLYDWPAANSNLAKAPAGIPAPPGYRPAIDQIDRDASVALVAHVDYWKNTLVWKNLYDQVTS